MTPPSDPRSSRNVDRFVAFSSLFTIAVGLMGLAGGFLHLQILRTAVPGLVAIKVNTAVCLILLALALWLLRKHGHDGPPPATEWIAKTMALAVASIGFLSLLEFVSGWDFSIDQILLPENAAEAIGSVRPGLMSPITAVTFVLLGVVLSLLNWRTREGVSLGAFLSFAAEIISSLTLLDLIAAPRALHMHIAVQTAVTLCVLPLGVVCAVVTGHGRSRRTKLAAGGEMIGALWLSRPETRVMLVVLAGAIFPPFFCLNIRFLAGTAAHILEPLHESFELVGSCIALSVAMLLLLRAQHKDMPPHFLWTAAALAAMGVVDGAHAVTHFGVAWSWMRHGATLIGGLVFAHVWVPLPPFVRRRKHFLVFAAIAFSIVACLTIWLYPGLLPLPWGPAGYSIWTKSVNLLGGLGFLVAAAFFLRRYLHQPETENLVFGCQTLLFSTAGLAFGFSHIWAMDWWVWHVLRLLAYFIALVVMYQTFLSDIVGRKLAEKRLATERQRFESVLDSLPAMICLLTPDHDVAFANQAFRSQFGESAGRKCHQYLFGSDTPCGFCQAFKVLETNAPHDWECPVREGRLLHVFNLPFADVDGSPLILEMDIDITEQRAAEKKLRQQAALLDLAHDAIFVRDLDSRVLFWNRGAADLYGWSAVEAGGKISHDLLKTEFPEPLETIEAAIKQTRGWGGEITQTSRAGTRIQLASRWSLLRDEKGNPTAILEINRDISERKRAEEKLRIASLYARTLLEASLDPLVTISREGKITDVNDATEKVTGVPREHLIGSDFSNYFTDPESARRGYEQVFAQGAVQDYPLAIRSMAGKVTDVLYNATVFKNEAGEAAGVFAAARDITEKKRAEEAVSAEREKFNNILDVLPPYVVLLAPDYHVAFANREFRRRFGDHNGRRCYEFLFSRAEPCEVCETYKVLQAKKPLEWKWTGPDGRHYDIYDFPFTDTDGSNLILEMGIDVTERRRAEEEIRKLNQELEARVQQRTAQLRESEQRVRRKLDCILSPEGDLGTLELADILDLPALQAMAEDFYKLTGVPLFILDMKATPLVAVGWQDICTKFHRVHPETCQNCVESDTQLSTGVAEGEFKIYKCKNNLWDGVTPLMLGGKHVGNVFTGQFFFDDEPVDPEAFRSHAKKYGFDQTEYLAALDRVPRLSRNQVKNASAFYTKFAQLLSVLSYSSIKLARSSTQIGRANAELAASIKELEAFSYSVSHDLRAPLRHISGFSKILLEEFGPSLPADAHHHLERIQEGTRRMGQLVDDLLELGRVGRREVNLQVTGLKSLVDEVIASLKADVADRQVEWKLGTLPFVDCDAGLMKQVFQNLLSNAVKFTRPRTHALIEIGQQEKDGVPAVYVRDNGVGFSMKYSDKLFGVFQRLHRQEDFEGTGVGLATVQRIVQKHGGRIWAEAELDRGATFYFTLANRQGDAIQSQAAVAGGKP